MGVVQNYEGLLVSRLFLGVTGICPCFNYSVYQNTGANIVLEGGLYPGVAYYITTWYCPHEAQFRQALFFSAASIAGAFSGLLAFGIAVRI